MRLSGALFNNPDLDLDVVTDGRSLLERVAQTPKAYDLIVLGYELPEISGPDCIAVLRKMVQRIPVLVLSPTLEDTRIAELAELGVRREHILQKSTTPTDFSAWIHKTLASQPKK